MSKVKVVRKKVLDEEKEKLKKRKEVEKILKGWAEGETTMYDEKGMRIGGAV